MVSEIVFFEIAGLRHFLPGVHFFQIFLVDFLGPFEALWVLLGRLLGFLRVSWEVSGPKNIKNHWVFSGFLKAVVGSLNLMMALLGSSWFLL